MGADDELIPLVTSVNVACGMHAGDPVTIERTIARAIECGAAVGAHPGYPDLAGFGRRELDMAPDELAATIVYQVGAVDAFARSAGTRLRHVKPHGALYNRAARDPAVAEIVTRAVGRVLPDGILVGLAGGALVEAGRALGLRVAAEAFADRVYEPDASLRSRRLPGAMVATPEAAAAQAVSIARDGRVALPGGGDVAVVADTICVHGDTPGAVEYARAIRSALEAAGVRIEPLASAG